MDNSRIPKKCSMVTRLICEEHSSNGWGYLEANYGKPEPSAGCHTSEEDDDDEEKELSWYVTFS
jgi:hypothetical protein